MLYNSSISASLFTVFIFATFDAEFFHASTAQLRCLHQGTAEHAEAG